MSIEFREARYIKLGPAGAWNDVSIQNGELHVKFGDISHELALTGNREAIRQTYLNLGIHPATASRFTNELLQFYLLGPDCLWVTFAHEHLWWTFAEAGVEWIEGGGGLTGFRKRRCRKRWSCNDVNGQPLRIDGLDGRLAQVRAFQGTICKIHAADYLRQRLNCEENPTIVEVRKAQEALGSALGLAIKGLNPTNTELLADLFLREEVGQEFRRLVAIENFSILRLSRPLRVN